MNPKESPKKPSPNPNPRPSFSAPERAQAVLTLWSRSQRPSAICRQMGIPPMMLSLWEKRAMAGMLQALEPRSAQIQAPVPLLASRLQRLLARLSTPGAAHPNRLARTPPKRQDTTPPGAPTPPA
jgi:transposase-like protein